MFKIPLDKLPKKGYIIADFADTTLFEPYEITDGLLRFNNCELFEKEIPFECHFFNEKQELRLIYRESRNDFIELLLSENDETDMDKDLLYTQEVLVKPEYACREDLPDKLRVINRFIFSENDTLILQNYRAAI